MASEVRKEIAFEIGHVLFLDIVGYSKLLINEQSEQLQKLKEIVRGTEQVRLAEAEGKLLRLPTGDGGALVFRNSPEAPVLCALEISKVLKSHPELRVRMGIHSGPVNEVTDLNKQANIAGAGINIAQRVMDCGDGGHILLSKRVADDLEQYPQWRSLLHDLGQCEVKHGHKISVINFYDDAVGNREVPQKFKTAAAAATAAAKPAVPKSALIGAAVLVLIGFSTVLFWQREKSKTSAPKPIIQEKSIAILPFLDLSPDKDQEYFSDGIAEELLNRLAQLRDLKVAARTSAFQFRGKSLDMADIGRQLKVGHVLEGSVRKSGGNLRISAQLIQCNSGYHIWSQAYDRQLDDVFAIQEEIARAIAEALSVQLKLGAASTRERPTQDMAAYGDYLEARALIAKRNAENLHHATTLLEAAVERDPGFAKAWAALAQARALGFYYLVASMEQSLEGAESAARKALTIDDSLGPAHSALADVLRDRYDWLLAEAEYRRALEISPGEAETHNQYAQMLLRVGHLDAALEHATRACELDPLASIPPSIVALIHLSRGDLAQGRIWLDRFEKARGEIDGLAIRLELIHALSRHDRDSARRTLAMARSSTAPELSSPADKKLIEALDEALASSGNSSELAPNLSRALTDARVLGEPHVGPEVAIVAAFLNQPEAALDALWADMPSAGVDLAWVWRTPPVWSLRNEPRFLELLRTIKLPEYWRVAGWPAFCRPLGANDFECIAP